MMKIGKVLACLTVNIKQFTREKSTIFFVLMFPILLMVLFGFIFADQGNIVYELPVQNHDGGYWADELVSGLNSTGVFKIKEVDQNEHPIDYMNDSGSNIIIVIPEGFSHRINNTHTVYYFLGEALKSTSEALNYSQLALDSSSDSLEYGQLSMNSSLEAMEYLELAANPTLAAFDSYNTALAIENTVNALNYTGLAMSSEGDVLTYNGMALQELASAMNHTINALTYEIVWDEAANITVKYDSSDTTAMTKVQIFSSVMDGFNKGLSGGKNVIGVEVDSVQSEKFEFIDFFAPGIIGMSVMTTALFGTVGMNTELRQKGILRKLATTPLSRTEWLLSNMLYQFFMAMLSTICILGVGIGMFGMQPNINIFMFLFIILNVFAFSGIGMLITRFVKEAESAQAAANAVMFPMMFLSGTFFSMEQMPDFLQSIAKFLPLYYVNEGLRSSMVWFDMGLILEYMTIIAIFGIVVFILGIFLTSWKDE